METLERSGRQRLQHWIPTRGLIAIVMVLWCSGTDVAAINLNPVGHGAHGGSRSLLTPSAVLRDGFWVGTQFQFADTPLTCELGANRSKKVNQAGIGTLTAGAGFLGGRLQLNVSVPGMWAAVTTSDADPLCPDEVSLDETLFGLNDPLLSSSFVILPAVETGLSLGIRADLGVPVSGIVGKVDPNFAFRNSFFGDEWGQLTLAISPGYKYEALTVDADFGLMLRPRSEVLGRAVGSGLVSSVGASLQVMVEGLYLVGDVYGTALFAAEPLDWVASTDPSLNLETMVGMRVRLWGMAITAGMGSALVNGPAASRTRIVVSMAWEGYAAPPHRSVLFKIADLVDEVFIAEQDEVPKDKRRRKRKKQKPCPDQSEMTEEEKLFMPEGCEPAESEPMPDPYADQSFEEVMCSEVVAAVCSGAGKLPPVVDRAAHFEFALGSSLVSDANVARLQRIATFKLPARRLQHVTIVGHADALGTDALNDALALKRAQAVAKVLIAAGVSATQIEVAARGERDPLVDVFDEVAGAPSNRRVDLTMRYEVIPETPAQESQSVSNPSMSDALKTTPLQAPGAGPTTPGSPTPGSPTSTPGSDTPVEPVSVEPSPPARVPVTEAPLPDLEPPAPIEKVKDAASKEEGDQPAPPLEKLP